MVSFLLFLIENFISDLAVFIHCVLNMICKNIIYIVISDFTSHFASGNAVCTSFLSMIKGSSGFSLDFLDVSLTPPGSGGVRLDGL